MVSKNMSSVGTRLNNKPLSTSLLGQRRRSQRVNSIFGETDGTSLDQLAIGTHVVWPRHRTKLDQRRHRPGPTGFQCQQPQKQDEAYAPRTYPCKNGLGCSAVTQSRKLLAHPVVEQLGVDWNTVSDPGAGSSEVNE